MAHKYIVTANRGRTSDPMNRYRANKYANMLKELGNVNVRYRRLRAWEIK